MLAKNMARRDQMIAERIKQMAGFLGSDIQTAALVVAADMVQDAVYEMPTEVDLKPTVRWLELADRLAG